MLSSNNTYSTIHSIKAWAEDDRPREKLINKSPKALSDAELIAIIIGSGTKSESAVDLAKKILSSVSNNLTELSKLDIESLLKFSGIGYAKAVSIVAALELGRRRRLSEGLSKRKVMCSRDAFEIMQPIIGDFLYEEFWIICLNQRNHVVKTSCISHGSSTGTVVDPKKVFKLSLENNATSVILCHNHPSGEVTPSQSDISITKKCISAGNFLELKVVDHIIVSTDKYYSFADEGMI